jgi:septal ring factor EnvC (AmiA/AmiB activator)
MTKQTNLLCLCLFLFGAGSIAQPQTREELERQRQELKREIEQTEKQLSSTRAQKQENLLQWKLINKKVNLQDQVINNINRDLQLLDNNIGTTQKDVRKYDRLLDTLKQEYARSMVYAYKNRSNYDILNFIFSSSNFNDAMKRLSYLKSYRNYREMQGQNILRTQELRKHKITELNGVKQKKNATLEVQNKELDNLAQQQKEKDRILSELKKQEKQLNSQITAKRKQMQKVDRAIAAAIKRAQDEAKRQALAKAAEDERIRKASEKANAANNPSSGNKTTKSVSASGEKIKAATSKKEPSVLLNADNIALNNKFEKNRGTLPWPVDRGTVLMHFGPNKLPSGSDLVVSSITIASEIGSPVKAIFDGTVTAIQPIEDMVVVIIQHGRYFTTYSNVTGVSVQRGQEVKTGQVLGKVAANFDGIGAIDFYLSNESSNLDPERWLRGR